MNQLNRKTLRKMILMEIRKVLQEQQINTSATAAEQYLKDRQDIISKFDPGPARDKELADKKKEMGVRKVEDIKDVNGKVVRKNVIFHNQEPGPSHEVPAEFEEESE